MQHLQSTEPEAHTSRFAFTFPSLLLLMTVFCLSARAQQDTVWGMTPGGGYRGGGTLFRMAADGSGFQVVYGFDVGSLTTDGTAAGASLMAYNGLLYGVMPAGGNTATFPGNGTIFSYNPGTATLQYLHDFNQYTESRPVGKLALDSANGLLYGVASDGPGNGAIFSINPATGAFTHLYDFPSYLTGWSPRGPMNYYNGIFYGMALGGKDSAGVIFSYDPATNAYTDLYDATDMNSSFSDGSLALYNNLFYGVTDRGGSQGKGVLFSFSPSTHAYHPLVSFNDTIGNYPIGLITYNGHLYGVTQGTGAIDANGELFSFDPGAGQLHVLYSFAEPTGNNPSGNLAGSGSVLLGLAQDGGAYNYGALYRYDLASGAYTDAEDFGYLNNGYHPFECQLLVVPHGAATPQHISFPDTVVYYGLPDTSLASTSSGLPVTYTSSDSAVATVTTDQKIHLTGAGTTRITVSQAGNTVYAAATDSVTLRVKPATLTITADNDTIAWLHPFPEFTATYSGFVYGQNTTLLTKKPILTTTARRDALPGTYPIDIGGAVLASDNYTIVYVPGTLVITLEEKRRHDSMEAWFSSRNTLQVKVYAATAQRALLQVFDMAGRPLIDKYVDLGEGPNTFTFYLNYAPFGIYTVHLTGNRLDLNEKIFKW